MCLLENRSGIIKHFGIWCYKKIIPIRVVTVTHGLFSYNSTLNCVNSLLITLQDNLLCHFFFIIWLRLSWGWGWPEVDLSWGWCHANAHAHSQWYTWTTKLPFPQNTTCLLVRWLTPSPIQIQSFICHILYTIIYII